MAKVIGIDFGTTSSRVAVMDGGTPTMIEIEGQQELPSCVAYSRTEGFLVGEAGRRQAILNAENTVAGLKHVLGRKYRDGAISRLKDVVPYELTQAENGDACLRIGRGQPHWARL
jgi:molecular chaperone DnaK